MKNKLSQTFTNFHKLSQTFTNFHKLSQTIFLSCLIFLSCNSEIGKSNQGIDQETEIRGACDQGDVTLCAPIPISTTIIIEGCQITANAIFYICNNNVVMSQPTWTYSNTTQCAKLKRKMYEKYTLPIVGLSQALDMYNNIHKTIVDRLQASFLFWANDNNGISIFPCFGGDCSSPGNTIRITLSQCITLCPSGINQGGGLDEDGQPIAIYQELIAVPCGEGCCKRETEFCIDQFQNICKGNTSYTQISPCSPTVVNCTQPTNVCSAPCDRL